MSANNKLSKINSLPTMGLITVLTVLVQTTQAQAYLLSLSQNPNVYPYRTQYQVGRSAYTLTTEIEENQRNNLTTNNAAVEDNENPLQKIDDNSTIIFIKNSNSSDLSQTAMDVITIVWYVATFLALAAFFLLMACSDRRCSDANANGTNTQNEAPIPPPTPSPSYSEFAPPSYETVMKTQNATKTKVFVIPFNKDNTKDNSNSISNNNNNISSNTLSVSPPPTPTSPIINFYTINELQKLGS